MFPSQADSPSGSREQNYRPEDCSICHAILIGKKGSGFWEGGKGTHTLACSLVLHQYLACFLFIGFRERDTLLG